MFKLTSLNLNGIRSAARKGVEAWLEKAKPDCICVQELKAQAPDIEGNFDTLSGLNGYFHYAQKKGYSGVGIYTHHTPSDVVVGFDGGEFDDEVPHRCSRLGWREPVEDEVTSWQGDAAPPPTLDAKVVQRHCGAVPVVITPSLDTQFAAGRA